MSSTNELSVTEKNAWGRYLVALLVNGAAIGAGLLLGMLAQMLIVDAERPFVEFIRNLLIPIGSILMVYSLAKTMLARRGFAVQVSGVWRLPAILFVGGLGLFAGLIVPLVAYSAVLPLYEYLTDADPGFIYLLDCAFFLILLAVGKHLFRVLAGRLRADTGGEIE